jgi:hypothetical protein
MVNVFGCLFIIGQVVSFSYIIKSSMNELAKVYDLNTLTNKKSIIKKFESWEV